MKKSLLLLVAGAMAMSASAQDATSPQFHTKVASKDLKRAGGKTAIANTGTNSRNADAAGRRSGARTTGYPSTCTYTETFPSTTLTAGGSGGAGDVWTSVATSGPGSFIWMETASTGTISLPALLSTTGAAATGAANNGWMIINSDSLAGGTGMGTVVPAGYLQSPATGYNCATLTSVLLSFQEVYAKFQDSAWVEVSGTGAAGPYTTYRIPVNDALNDNDITANPDTIKLDISATAAGRPDVVIRFVYSGPPGGGYSWAIDDICVGPKLPDDIGLELSWVYEPNCTSTSGANDGSMFATPINFVDSIYPVSRLSNYGANAETSVALTSQVYYEAPGGTSYTSSYTYAPTTYGAMTGYTSLPVDAVDSFVEFDANGYWPASVGNYFVAMGASVTGDGDPANNQDTVAFSVTDTIWEENTGSFQVDEGYYVYHASTNSAFFEGARFDVPCNPPYEFPVKGDTISGFGVVFSSSSVVGAGKVEVQLYQASGKPATSYTFLGSSVEEPIAASMFSTTGAGGVKWINFPVDVNTYGYAPFVMQPGNTYAAVVQCDACTKDLVVCGTNAFAGSGYAPGYFGQSDASSNDGTMVTNFGATGDITNIGNIVPLVRMHNGKVPTITVSGVQNVTLDNFVGHAFPNPSTASFAIPLTMAQDSKVTATLTDIMGQVINTQTINAAGSQATSIIFNTSNLADGIYIYAIQANGVNTTGRVVVAH